MIPNVASFLRALASEPGEESNPKIYPFLSPQIGFKSDFLVGKDRLPVRGPAMGYDLGIQFGIGFQKKDNFHLLGLQNRFKDVYDIGGSTKGVDWKTWNFQLVYSYNGSFQGGIGHGYSWTRREDSPLDSRDGFHLNMDFRINPLFLAKKIYWLTMEIQAIELDIYYRLGSIGLGAGLYLKGWIPLGG